MKKKKKEQLSPLCQLVLAKAIEADQDLPEWYLIFPEGILLEYGIGSRQGYQVCKGKFL